MRIIFMGTPEFATPTLKSLIESNHEILAVYSAPPKPAKRKQILTNSPIHNLALEHGLHVETPKSLRSIQEQEKFRNFQADLAIVAAYGLILPKEILQAPKHGCFNIHPSKLPKYRGAAPIERSIENGETDTEVCIMQMDEGLDTGDVLKRQHVEIQEKNAAQMHKKLSNIGAKLILETINDLAQNVLTPEKQSNENITYADKISKNEGEINWQEPAQKTHNKIRALINWPTCNFTFNGEKIKIYEAEIIETKEAFQPGQVLVSSNELIIACGENALKINQLQRPGKKILNAADFLRGTKIPANIILSK